MLSDSGISPDRLVLEATETAAAAEFVESEAILGLLIEIGIDYAQGFHIARPAPTLESPAIERHVQQAYKVRNKRYP